jgi:hypothetical protein
LRGFATAVGASLQLGGDWPENDSDNDVAISINQSPQGTAISVIQSVHREDAGKAATPPKP